MTLTPPPTELVTQRLTLEPLSATHAAEMVPVLSDQSLYTYTGGEPPNLADLQRRYTAQAAGSGDDAEQWHNWILRLRTTRQAIGFVQATVEPARTEIAWTTGAAWQQNGYAREAALAMTEWLRSNGASALAAWIHPDHTASHKIAQAVGLSLTDETDDDGEQLWS